MHLVQINDATKNQTDWKQWIIRFLAVHHIQLDILLQFQLEVQKTPPVGIPLGTLVGLPVASPIGITVGSPVGSPVGTPVASAVAIQVGTSVGKL